MKLSIFLLSLLLTWLGRGWRWTVRAAIGLKRCRASLLYKFRGFLAAGRYLFGFKMYHICTEEVQSLNVVQFSHVWLQNGPYFFHIHSFWLRFCLPTIIWLPRLDFDGLEADLMLKTSQGNKNSHFYRLIVCLALSRVLLFRLGCVPR